MVQGDLVAGRWRLGEQLGRGAVADVFLGTDEATGERVAVKVLRRAEPDQLVRFDREVAALESLDHPGVVRVRGHGDLDGRPFVVLDCIDGGSLAEELAARGPMAPERAAALGAALADALAHAHARGIVHRDVKPSNVLLDADGNPRLADFGVALLDGADTLTQSGFTVGTAAYLAPEQVRGEPVGPAADVYALGLVVLEAATGARAYPGSGVTAAMARLDRAPDIPASLPRRFAALLRSMTAMAPGDRPSAAAVAGELSVLAGDEGDGGTVVLPIADDATELVVVAAPTVVPPAGAPPRPPATPRPPGAPAAAAVAAFVERHRGVLVPVGCFVLGFLLVLAVRAMADGGDGADTPVLVTSTTAAPPPPSTTAPPTTAPPPPPEEDEDRGRGRGRDRDDD